MYHVMFDIDGTLVQSFDFDEQCFISALMAVTGHELSGDWHDYPNVTDRGILKTFIEKNSLDVSLEDLENEVREIFTKNIEQHLIANSIEEVSGAKRFLERLQADDRFVVSLATGGWLETALLKLDFAGFDVNRLSIASSNDHHQRSKIMAHAKSLVGDKGQYNLTYFGDGPWDVHTCGELDINLVLVGGRVRHHQAIPDFSDFDQAIEHAIG